MKEFIGKKVLVTTSSWFYGKDGMNYRAIYGTLKGIHEAKDKVGFVPNRAHANWFFEIGTMVIMGCQIMYVQQIDDVHLGKVHDYNTESGQFHPYIRPSAIYPADEIKGAAEAKESPPVPPPIRKVTEPKPTPRHERSM